MEETSIPVAGNILALQTILRLLLINAARDGEEGLAAVRSWRQVAIDSVQAETQSADPVHRSIAEAALKSVQTCFDEALTYAQTARHSHH